MPCLFLSRLLVYSANIAFISAAAYSVWAMLLKHNPVSKVAVFGFMNPVCGVVISAIVLHESNVLNLSFLTALLLVCAGIVIVNLQTDRKPSAGRQDALIIAGNLDPQKCGYVYDLEEIPLPCPVNLYGIHLILITP